MISPCESRSSKAAHIKLWQLVASLLTSRQQVVLTLFVPITSCQLLTSGLTGLSGLLQGYPSDFDTELLQQDGHTVDTQLQHKVVTMQHYHSSNTSSLTYRFSATGQEMVGILTIKKLS